MDIAVYLDDGTIICGNAGDVPLDFLRRICGKEIIVIIVDATVLDGEEELVLGCPAAVWMKHAVRVVELT